MAFEKSVPSIVAYGLYLTCVTSIDFTIHARHAHGLFVMKCITITPLRTLFSAGSSQLLYMYIRE